MRTFVLPAVLAAALLSGCKRDTPTGTPTGDQWGAGPSLPPKDPTDKADPRNQQLGGNPHGNMGGGGGGPQGDMPDDDVHRNAGGGGGGPSGDMPDDDVHKSAGGAKKGGHGADKSAMTGTEETGPRTLEKQADGRYVLGPFTVAVPADWTIKPVTTGMRAAAFAVGDAEMVVYYQGEMGMGSVKDNIDRWSGQVKGTPKVEQLKFAGQDAHYITVTGDYENTTPGMAGSAKGQTFVGVILASPQGPYYFKLVGAKATIDPQLPKIRAMFDSLKLKS